MNKLDIREKIWGGTFGVIAVIAAIGEMVAAGINTATALGAVKDVFGTLVVVVVMVAVVRLLSTKKLSQSFEERLTSALTEWINEHSNMIVRTSKMPKGHENDFGMSMTTDINRFYNNEILKSDNGNGVGRFMRLTEIDEKNYSSNDVEIDFFINAQTYCNSSDESKIENELMEIGRNLASYMKGSFSNVRIGEPKRIDDRTFTISIQFIKPIVTEDGDNINLIINVIDRMYQAMLVSARRR